MSDHKVKIVASSVEEFDKIDKLLKTLPQEVYDQIETAKNHVGLECTYKTYTGGDVFLPGNVKKQYVEDDNTVMWCGDKMEFRFVLPKELTNSKKKFIFLPMKQQVFELPKMKTEFTEKTGEWTAYLDGMPIVVTGNTEREAFEELIKSISVKLLHDAGKNLGQLKTQS